MIEFILNDQKIETDLPGGMTVLDFVRYRKNLKGTKIGCREGDCGACTIMVGQLDGGRVKYRTQTSCLMPLANAASKHIVTVEGINKPENQLTEVQQAMVDESGTQCGFCTVGFVMSLTNFCIDETPKTRESAISAIDGNICRCTGYKSIERAALRLIDKEIGGERETQLLEKAVASGNIPQYFSGIKNRLEDLTSENPKSKTQNPKSFVGGGTDLYVQRPEELVSVEGENLFDNSDLRFISETDEFVEIGASTVVTDLIESPIMQRLFPDLYRQLKLISSTPIRNMATLAGNFINASPIGDMTIWFLALDAEIELIGRSPRFEGRSPRVSKGADPNLESSAETGRSPRVSKGAAETAESTAETSGSTRTLPLKNLYLGYKQISKTDEEFITRIRFRKDFTHFNFEKVSKRTYLDIATVNTAISLKSEPSASAGGLTVITEAHIAIGGVAPIPLYLRKTSEFLKGREISKETTSQASEILQTEISPISDVRGSESYKRLLARQLFTAHFVELFGLQFNL